MSDYIRYIDERSVQLGDDAIDKGYFDLGIKLYYIALDKVRRYQGDRMGPMLFASNLISKIEQINSTLSQEVSSLGHANWKLSKSSFIKGKQCHKYLYLDRYKKHERTPPDKETIEKFKKGHLFEDHFRQTTFPDGINIKEKLGMNFGYFKAYTDNLINSASSITLFEGAFVEDEILVMVDVMKKQNNDSYDFYEIKLHQALNEVIWNDLAVQYYVCKKKFGNRINNFNVVLRKNKNDWQIIELKNEIEERIKNIKAEIKEYKFILAQKVEPNVNVGNHCKNPYRCEFIQYCTSK